MVTTEDLILPADSCSDNAPPALSIAHFMAFTVGCALAMANSGFENLLVLSHDALVSNVMIVGALVFDLTWALALGGLFVMILLSIRGWHPSTSAAHYSVASLGVVALAVLAIGWTRPVDSSELKLSQMVLLVAIAIQSIILFLAIRNCKLNLLVASFGFTILINMLLIATISNSPWVTSIASIAVPIALIAQCITAPFCLIEAFMKPHGRDWLEWFGLAVYFLVYAVVPLYWLGVMVASGKVG